jgi:hypothetical protein
MKDTFSSAELTALRNDLIHDILIDSTVPEGTRFRGVARCSPTALRRLIVYIAGHVNPVWHMLSICQGGRYEPGTPRQNL